MNAVARGINVSRTAYKRDARNASSYAARARNYAHSYECKHPEHHSEPLARREQSHNRPDQELLVSSPAQTGSQATQIPQEEQRNMQEGTKMPSGTIWNEKTDEICFISIPDKRTISFP